MPENVMYFPWPPPWGMSTGYPTERGSPSFGQHLMMGSSKRLTSLPVLTTSWHGPDLTNFGAKEAIFASSKPFFILFIRPVGGSGLMSDSIFAARPSKPTSRQSSAISMRVYDPKALMSTGKSEPSTFSKSSALPPRCAFCGSNFLACSEMFGAGDFETLSVICVISRMGETCAVMRCSSPAWSSAFMNWFRSLYAICIALFVWCHKVYRRCMIA